MMYDTICIMYILIHMLKSSSLFLAHRVSFSFVFTPRRFLFTYISWIMRRKNNELRDEMKHSHYHEEMCIWCLINGMILYWQVYIFYLLLVHGISHSVISACAFTLISVFGTRWCGMFVHVPSIHKWKGNKVVLHPWFLYVSDDIISK